eukprot:CAMPEP_0172047250 /NCGR_PEP_ID=MMETSP1043-20130122/890_1 /TAXON_ID=464988 /ORGANISM="Hemiselmis andersenii, Strain CCMP441" /LENGTH=163 /DNA_ID=CAMNT_0012706055 /DNA_START=88 /DNA_END=576 /DNA_ORIENTATION=+
MRMLGHLPDRRCASRARKHLTRRGAREQEEREGIIRCCQTQNLPSAAEAALFHPCPCRRSSFFASSKPCNPFFCLIKFRVALLLFSCPKGLPTPPSPPSPPVMWMPLTPNPSAGVLLLSLAPSSPAADAAACPAPSLSARERVSVPEVLREHPAPISLALRVW